MRITLQPVLRLPAAELSLSTETLLKIKLSGNQVENTEIIINNHFIIIIS